MRVIIFLLSLVQPVIASAHNTLFSHGLNSNFVFTLDLAQEEFFQPVLAPAPVGRMYSVSAEFLETYNRFLQGGLHVGRYSFEGTTTDASALADMGGNFAGMRVQLLFWDGPQLKWGIDSLYHYYQADNKTTPASSWHTLRFASAMSLTVFEKLTFYGILGTTGGYGKVTSSQRQSFTWTTHPRMLGVVGIDSEVDPGGHVGIEYQLTDFNNISLYLQRRY